jgi:NADH dehydrogenase
MNQTTNPATRKRPEVIIIGGGFAGLNVAKGLKNAPVQVTLGDQRNYHLFQPLLYQVATGILSNEHIAAPIRTVLKQQENVRVVMTQAEAIDLEAKTVSGLLGTKHYDYLVVASGATQSYFGNDHFKPFAPGLKTLDDAMEIRQRIVMAFEGAEIEADEDAQRARLTFIIVGGGPTGVEMSGSIMDMATRTLPKEFRHVDTSTTRVILVEGTGRLLGAMPEAMGGAALRELEAMGVEVRLNSFVTSVDADGVVIGDERVPAENVFWAAGVQGAPIARTLGVELDRAGRVKVGPDLSIPGHPEVFVIGDAAAATDAKTGKPVPGVAQGAVQTGSFVANIICQDLKGVDPKDRPAFSYDDLGSMAIIGRSKAVVSRNGKTFGGLLGWLAWNVIHVMPLVGFRTKLFVNLQWVWNFLQHERASRLVTGHPDIRFKEVIETKATKPEKTAT